MAARLAIHQIIDLRITLRYMGVPLDGNVWLFGDNESVIKSSIIPSSTLGKRHNALLGIGYVFSAYAVGIAFGSEDGATDNDFWAASVSGAFSNVDFSFLVADSDAQDDVSYGASISVPVGAATSIQAVVNDNGQDADDTAYGVGFRHDLGGGVSLRGGIGNNPSDNTVADLGVIFNF